MTIHEFMEIYEKFQKATGGGCLEYQRDNGKSWWLVLPDEIPHCLGLWDKRGEDDIDLDVLAEMMNFSMACLEAAQAKKNSKKKGGEK